MALCPFAELKLLPENNTQASIAPRAVILHSAGGHSELYGFWQNPSSHGLECHFFIADGETKGYNDGDLVQYIDTSRRADANGEANSFAISVETASTVNASEPWTPAQVATLIRLIKWLNEAHPAIELRGMNTPTDRGIAWHVQFGAPGPWTKVRGKVCPGPARIEQVKNVIIPGVAKATPVLPPKPKGVFMALSDTEQKELLDKVRELHEDYAVKGKSMRQVILEIAERTKDLVTRK